MLLGAHHSNAPRAQKHSGTFQIFLCKEILYIFFMKINVTNQMKFGTQDVDIWEALPYQKRSFFHAQKICCKFCMI